MVQAPGRRIRGRRLRRRRPAGDGAARHPEDQGPHGITLLAHARAGGPDAEPVLKYLLSVGDADLMTEVRPLVPSDQAAVVGVHAFGPRPEDRFQVDEVRGALGITRTGGSRRALPHRGALAFSPSGADAVRVRFVREANGGVALTVADPGVLVTARKIS